MATTTATTTSASSPSAEDDLRIVDAKIESTMRDITGKEKEIKEKENDIKSKEREIAKDRKKGSKADAALLAQLEADVELGRVHMRALLTGLGLLQNHLRQLQEQKGDLMKAKRLRMTPPSPHADVLPPPPPTLRSLATAAEARDFVENTLLTIPVTLNGPKFEDNIAQGEALGSLRDENYRWPVVKRKNYRVDMRLFPRRDLNKDADALPPAARAILDHVRGLKTMASIGLVAASGSGKTWSIFSLASEVYVIYIQASDENSHIQTMKHPADRETREFDHRFLKVYTELSSEFARLKLKDIEDDYQRRWDLIQRHYTIDLVSRFAELVKLKETVRVTPVQFLHHQVCGGDEKFSEASIRELTELDNASVSRLIDALYERITVPTPSSSSSSSPLSPGLSERCPLVVAIDEVEVAQSLFGGKVRSDHYNPTKGLLSPLARAAGEFAALVKGHLVFAGTGTSKSRIVSLKSDIGKTKDPPLVFYQDLFPLVTENDVVTLLGRLNLGPQEDREALLALPLTRLSLYAEFPVSTHNSATSTAKSPASDAKKPIVQRIREKLMAYVVGSRGRMLASIIEKIPVGLVGVRATTLLEKSLDATIASHKEGVHKMLFTRLGPWEGAPVPPFPVNLTVPYLQQCCLLAKFTDGEAGFPEEECPFIISDAPSPSSTITATTTTWRKSKKAKKNEQGQTLVVRGGDLVELGVACAREKAPDGQGSSFADKIQERFVVEAIEEYMKDEQVSKLIAKAKLQSVFDNLVKTLELLGSAAQGKGNIFEAMIVQRLPELAKRYSTIGELPFVKPFLRGNEAKRKEWENVPFAALEVLEAGKVGKGVDTPTFLANDGRARRCVYWPEDACRPDAIVMLGESSSSSASSSSSSSPPPPFRAMTFASAVYSDKVSNAKTEDQVRSSDLSRAFLQKRDKINLAAVSLRAKWVAKGLDRTRCIRVLVTLPREENPASVPVHLGKMRTDEGGAYLMDDTPHGDLIIRLDMTNIHLLIGDASEVPKGLYDLLAFMTRTEKKDWPGAKRNGR